jgi:antitoxin HigA-1
MGLSAIYPGEHLAEELRALDMSAAELARRIGVPTNRVTQILNGTRSITGDTPLRLGHFFGTARNSGSTCRASTTCDALNRKPGSPSDRCPGCTGMSPCTRKGFALLLRRPQF